jgi:hypothetical protein
MFQMIITQEIILVFIDDVCIPKFASVLRGLEGRSWLDRSECYAISDDCVDFRNDCDRAIYLLWLEWGDHAPGLIATMKSVRDFYILDGPKMIKLFTQKQIKTIDHRLADLLRLSISKPRHNGQVMAS